MRRRTRVSFSWVAAFTLACAPSVARADNVLVFGRYDGVAVLTSQSAEYASGVLTELGDTVTYVYGFGLTVPADMSSYQRVYIVTAAGLMPSELDSLRNYVQNGGHLFVTGEEPNSVFDASNATLQSSLVVPLVGAVTIGTGVAAGDTTSYRDEADDLTTRDGFSSTPNALTSWIFVNPGAMTVPSANYMMRDPHGNILGAMWGPTEISGGRGCLAVVMDTGFWYADSYGPSISTHPQTLAEVANLEHWLTHCADGAPPPPDAGPRDAGPPHDAAMSVDASVRPDAGTDAAVLHDAGMDAGLRIDAGPRIDAGMRADASTTPDASGAVDAGSALDASRAPDAAAARDATVALDAGDLFAHGSRAGGCSCRLGGRSESAPSACGLALAVAALASGIRTSRRRRRATSVDAPPKPRE